ncbi:MCE family protein [Nonomuraea sp. NBC_01738]|uniref:MCE family protein n=1 Tax=Nonomuraea sp. NBC_01738 TaxID=2976003 RepID=UPI002E0D64EF|nr:MCE family protein [Nonomuraea sp. NBC_01738]
MRHGAMLVAIVVAFVVITVGAYFQVFSARTEVTLSVPRAGLQLGPRADVKVRGVVVGEVDGVRATPTDAELTLALDAPVDRASRARLLPKTLLGEKYVDLVPPGTPTTPLEEGDRLVATQAAVEMTQILDRLLPLLRAVRPERLNTALTALATALEGRGARLGATLDRADDYLVRLEPYLPTIRRDLAALADVTGLYGDAAPDLLRTLGASADLSRVVTERRARLDELTRDVPRMAAATDRLLTANETGLVALQHVARPGLALAARYAPTIPCVFQGLNRLRPLLDEAFGDGSAKAVLELVKPAAPYRPGDDRPQYADARGPSCYGLPSPRVPFPGVRFADGTDDLAGLMLR